MSKPGLTKRQRKLIGPYVREIADTLNLRDWTFHIDHEPIESGDQAMACISLTHGRSVAWIRFGARFAEEARETQREIVVHELLHCFIPARRHLYGVDQLIGRPATLVLEEALNLEFERATDAIGNAAAKLLPLPPKLTKGKR